MYQRLRDYFSKTTNDVFQGNGKYQTKGYKFWLDEEDHLDYTAEVECIDPILHWIIPFVPSALRKGNEMSSLFYFSIKARMYQEDDSIMHVFIQSLSKDPVYYRVHLRVMLDSVETIRAKWLHRPGDDNKNNNNEKMKFRIILQEIHFDKIDFFFPMSPLFITLLKRHVETMQRQIFYQLSKEMTKYFYNSMDNKDKEDKEDKEEKEDKEDKEEDKLSR